MNSTMETKDGMDDGIAKPTVNVESQDPCPIQAKAATTMLVSYRECKRNHAASMGAVVVDGCGEFMPMPMPCTEQQQQQQQQKTNDFKCAVCGCHRNFHRKHVEMHYQKQVSVPVQCVTVPVVGGAFGTDQDSSSEETEMLGSQPKKRFRTKFSAEQKAKMFDFAEQMGWRVQRSDDSMVGQFCAEVGVKRRVFKVWIHNQKQALKKKQRQQS